MATITGRVEIRVDGQLLLSKKGATLQFGGVERRPIIEDNYHGYVEEVMAAICTVTVTDRDDINVTALIAITNGTIFFEAVGGKTYVMRNATCKANPTLTGGEGALELEFFGPGPARELGLLGV